MANEHQWHTSYWVRVSCLAVCFFFAAQLSTTALNIQAAASPLWPPAGIALAALLVYGQKLWVGVALGALWASLADQVPWWQSLVLCFGSALQALVGSYVLRRRWERSLQLYDWQLDDLLTFVGLGVLLTPIVNAVYSTSLGYGFGFIEGQNLVQNAIVIWLGDGMGILVLTPLLLAIAAGWRHAITLRIGSKWELGLCLGMLVAISTMVFGAQTDSAIAKYPLEYLPFPFVVWSALRLGLRGTTLASFLVSVIAVIGAVHRGGPFITKADGNLGEAILLLQTYAAVISITALVLSVVVTERQQSLAKLARSEASLANAQRIAQLGNWDWSIGLNQKLIDKTINTATTKTGENNLVPNNKALAWSNELYTLLGYPVGAVPPSQSLFLERVHPDDQRRVGLAWNVARTHHKPYRLDYRLTLPNGTERIVNEQVHIEPDRITGTVQDITERKRAEAALRETEAVRATMYRYLSQELAEQLLDSKNTKLGGARQFVSILFADIRSYTSLTEQLSPEEIVTLLNRYFEAMVDVIFEHRGTLDKFIGDAIMAVFGSPIPQEDHAQRAVITAIGMQQQLDHFNQQQQSQGRPTLQIGIGINSDDVITGNIGSSKRMEFTAIGDGVNLTSRIESATKFYGCSIIISENTYALCKDTIWVRELDYVCVRGKRQPVYLYEVLGLRSHPLTPTQQEQIDLYAKGRTLYQQRQFDLAAKTFSQLLRHNPDDQATRLYVKRCQQLQQEPPSSDWDGSWQLQEK
ncbi:MASE1 domain-containing protein [Leptothoe spongobia]|uniref:MASE1 domain-containing protein n=1 Tax=Leptothoe spongobia TAU-MAC 1115 TaxID=1967444 RepID=A0A947DI73_9CYAN|nr:MASE1 domain-containing protein [Leptothoe spongobia]MBT9317662.1 MASE1 domain-containing protein [Leptothoe spongobia TAU-MAC 1115]